MGNMYVAIFPYVFLVFHLLQFFGVLISILKFY